MKRFRKKAGFTLAEGATHVGNCHNTRRVAFTLAEGAAHVGISHNTRRVAFTLAEVLITLGIIGIVSAMTIPTLINKYQQLMMVSHFKKAYALLVAAYKLAAVDFGATPPKCGYWSSNPYTAKGYTVTTIYDENGDIKTYRLTDKNGNSVPWPNDFNGPMSDCLEYGQLIINRLKVAKDCKGNALQKGCTPKDGYSGVDTVYKNSHSDLSDAEINMAISSNAEFKSNRINNTNRVIVLQGGVTIIGASTSFYPNYFLLDTNGPSGPNKWGYDLHIISHEYNESFSDTQLVSNSYFTQSGGIPTRIMIEKIRNNQKQ